MGILGAQALTRLLALAVVLALAFSLHPLLSPAHAQPSLVESTPADGAIINAPPDRINLCFNEPIRTDFHFTLRIPNDRTTSFTPLLREGRDCVELLVRNVPENVRGLWTLEWRVSSQQSTAARTGSLDFTVRGGSSAGGPGGAAPADGGPDLFETPVITAAAFGIAALVGLLLYAIRRKIGFDMHRPPPEGAGDDHH
jgi:methionine-rich copper-binding protein CopC